MEKLYLIMEECLKNQYGMKAVLLLLETLEASYSIMVRRIQTKF